MREKLIELLDDIQIRGEDFTDYEIYGMRLPNTVSNEDVADHLIANGVTFATDNNVGGKWIPVTERLPERGVEVLVCDTREDYVSIWEHMGDGLWFGNEVIWATEDITHWMPLPEPPKEVE